MSKGTIKKVAGPLVIAEGMRDANMFDVVRVSGQRLIGEIIEIHGDEASIQVYEETSGLGPGEPVESTGVPMSVELGPGLISNIYDGIQRPLEEIRAKIGNSLARGVEVPSLDREKKWHFTPVVRQGDAIVAGDVIGTVQETEIVLHRIMAPVGVVGTIKSIEEGDYNITETVAVIETANGTEQPLTLMQRWPVRRGRPYKEKLSPDMPLVTGQRVIDALFPIAKGGVAAVPGPFGSGKTVIQHQLAKWAEADIVVYIGCGERGNEMTDVLNEFPELKDPKTGRSLMERTVLIANTSDMPVAAREASIYTGITIAEYFRDMGYSVALMADSTSRWAEALREMSLRIVKVFWSLDAQLAYQRHFPAINWLTSYSLYTDTTEKWFNENVAAEWSSLRQRMMLLLQEESELQEIVQLVGMDALSAPDRIKLEAARSIREDFLHQNSFHDVDTYTPLPKQFTMMKLVLDYYDAAVEGLSKGIPVDSLVNLPVREQIGRFKYILPDQIGPEYESIQRELASEIAELAAKQKEEF